MINNISFFTITLLTHLKRRPNFMVVRPVSLSSRIIATKSNISREKAFTVQVLPSSGLPTQKSENQRSHTFSGKKLFYNSLLFWYNCFVFIQRKKVNDKYLDVHCTTALSTEPMIEPDFPVLLNVVLR